MPKIIDVRAREVLDSRGFPTIEVELAVQEGDQIHHGRAIVPSGASTGEGEALELRDLDPKRYFGKGVLKAVRNVHEKIAPSLLNRNFPLQSLLDDALCDLDGTENKSKLGANALLGVSLAFARAHALSQNLSLTHHLARSFETDPVCLPVPLMNVINGGKHADNGLAIQEFMIIPAGFNRFSEALRAGAEIFHRLKKLLSERNLSTGVGDEGGFAPLFDLPHPHEHVLLLLTQAIRDAGYHPGKEVFLGLDCAASEFADSRNLYSFEGAKRSSLEMIEVYKKWTQDFPIVSIEDGLAEKDWDGWKSLTQQLGKKIQLVGDDLFVTNTVYLKKGIDQKIANAILIKPNQIGTLTETLETMKMAAQAKYPSVVSHRSGESEDPFIADLAVATNCGQIKCGSLSRSDRLAKYNQLLRIEESLGEKARFGGMDFLKRFSG